MKLQYFDDSDMLYIKLIEGVNVESEEVTPGIVLENASKLIEMSQLEVQTLPIISFAFNRQFAAVG